MSSLLQGWDYVSVTCKLQGKCRKLIDVFYEDNAKDYI